MAVINLGSRLNIDNKKTIILPGIKDKKFTIVFNDAFAKKVNRAMLELRKVGIEYDKKTSDEALADMSPEEADKTVNQAFDSTREATEKLADQVLGEKGIGKLMYKVYNHDTTAIAAVIGTLNDMAQEAIKDTNAEKEKRKMQNQLKKATKHFTQPAGQDMTNF
ncbi:hypothetical protein [Lactobacillus crispatus]|uniref:hypothetical protein n=1 Tax=Lactobacillus crispatus TaxID=47770 RepID=UPI0015DFCA5E|nr:hypothetical protein [Lactobacillus crispatus]QLK33430.1 hypothetical protein H0G71_04305 [Lactobacillus crispatus]